jgi:hypothetical protein
MNFLWIEKPRGLAISKTNPVMDRHEIVRPPMVRLTPGSVEDPSCFGKIVTAPDFAGESRPTDPSGFQSSQERRRWDRASHLKPGRASCASAFASPQAAENDSAACSPSLISPRSQREKIEDGSHRAAGRGRPCFYARCYRHRSRLVPGTAFFRTLPGVLWSIDGVSRVECRRCARVALWLRR